MTKVKAKEEEKDPISDLERMLAIDEERLSAEWADQPFRYVTAVRVCAQSERTLSERKLDLEALEADLDRKYRIEGIPGGIKLTEPAMNNAITCHPEYIMLRTLIIDCQHRLTLCQGLVRAFEQRERSLKYIQMSRSLPLLDEDRELGRAAREHALRGVVGGR